MNKLKSFLDEELIQNVLNNNCSDCLNELVNRHGGMCFAIGKKYAKTCGLDLNDLNDNKYWIIFNALLSYNPNKNTKFSTWLGNQVRFFCLNYKNKNKNYLSMEDNKSIDFFNIKNNPNNEQNKEEVLNIIKDLFNQISDSNTKNAVYYRYFYNKDRILNYAEIAEILKVTPQTVLNWHNKFIKYAKKKLTSK